MIDYDTIRVSGDIDINLPLIQVDPADSYVLREAEGITAPEFNMQIANTLYQGGVFQNRQAINKQIVLSIRLFPNHGAGETAKSLRQNLYKMLSPRWERALKVQLLLAGSVIAEIEGHVSGMPMNPFVKDPEVQVVIDCLSARWFAPTPVNYLPPSPSNLVIDYRGSAPVGFWAQLQFTHDYPSFQLHHTDNSQQKINLVSPRTGSGSFETGFRVNDILTIDTRPGTRGVSITRNATTMSILSSMSKDSKWLEIFEGINDFTINPTGFVWLGVSYTPQFWGA